MASEISGLPTNAVDRLGMNAKGYADLLGVTDGWRNFFAAVLSVCSAVSERGTTAQRPTSNVWVGRMYFDTSLGANGGKPIWAVSIAAGVVTWVDASGAVV